MYGTRLLRQPDLDALVDAPRREHVDRLYGHRCCAVRHSVRRCTRRRCSTPRHARDEMRVGFERFDAATGGEVPCSDRLVVRGGKEEFARGVEDESANPVVVCGREARQRRFFSEAKWRGTHGQSARARLVELAAQVPQSAHQSLQALST